MDLLYLSAEDVESLDLKKLEIRRWKNGLEDVRKNHPSLLESRVASAHRPVSGADGEGAADCGDAAEGASAAAEAKSEPPPSLSPPKLRRKPAPKPVKRGTRPAAVKSKVPERRSSGAIYEVFDAGVSSIEEVMNGDPEEEG